MNLEELKQHLGTIESLIGYTFRDKELLIVAFVHRSYVNENRLATQHNERMEFLGDSVLGLLIAHHLFLSMPNVPEGELSFLRSRLVEAGSCMRYVQQLNLDRFLLLGKGERMNDGRGRESILADLFEAIIGAVYLDGGLDAAGAFLFGKLHTSLDGILKMPLQNWKALLQDYCQKKYQAPPVYQVISETGPDHSKYFEIGVVVNGVQTGRGSGASKKEAQQAAAKDAIERLAISS